MANETLGGIFDPLTGVPLAPSPQAQGKFGRIADALVGGLQSWIETPGRAMREGITTDQAVDWAAPTALGMIAAGRLPGGAPEGAVGSSGAPLRRVVSPADLDPSSKVNLGTLFRGTETGPDRIAALRWFEHGDVGSGVYATPEKWLAETYGGGPKASVQKGTRTVHEYGSHPQYPEDVAYLFGGTKPGENVSLVSGNGIELWSGPWSPKLIEEQLKKHDFKAVIGGAESIGANQVAVRDPRILYGGVAAAPAASSVFSSAFEPSP